MRWALEWVSGSKQTRNAEKYITPHQNRMREKCSSYVFVQSFLDQYWWHKANNVCIGHYRAEISDKHIVIHGNTLSEYQVRQSRTSVWGRTDELVWRTKYIGSCKISQKRNPCPFFTKIVLGLVAKTKFYVNVGVLK